MGAWETGLTVIGTVSVAVGMMIRFSVILAGRVGRPSRGMEREVGDEAFSCRSGSKWTPLYWGGGGRMARGWLLESSLDDIRMIFLGFLGMVRHCRGGAGPCSRYSCSRSAKGVGGERATWPSRSSVEDLVTTRLAWLVVADGSKW